MEDAREHQRRKLQLAVKQYERRVTAADHNNFVLKRSDTDEHWLREMSSDDQLYAMRVVPKAECNGYCCYYNSHDKDWCRHMPEDDVPWCAKYRANLATCGGKCACCGQLACMGLVAYLMTDPIGWVSLKEDEVESFFRNIGPELRRNMPRFK